MSRIVGDKVILQPCLLEGPRRNIAITFGMENLERCGHSLAKRQICSTSAETQDRKCFTMHLILVIGKVVIVVVSGMQPTIA